jgi:hypothetical protein
MPLMMFNTEDTEEKQMPFIRDPGCSVSNDMIGLGFNTARTGTTNER